MKYSLFVSLIERPFNYCTRVAIKYNCKQKGRRAGLKLKLASKIDFA